MLGQQVIETKRHSGTMGREMEAFRERTQQFSNPEQKLQYLDSNQQNIVASTPNPMFLSTTFIFKYVYTYNFIYAYIKSDTASTPFGQIAGVSNLQLFPYELLQGTYLQSYTYLHPFAFTLLTLSHSFLLYNLSVSQPVGYK